MGHCSQPRAGEQRWLEWQWQHHTPSRSSRGGSRWPTRPPIYPVPANSQQAEAAGQRREQHAQGLELEHFLSHCGVVDSPPTLLHGYRRQLQLLPLLLYNHTSVATTHSGTPHILRHLSLSSDDVPKITFLLPLLRDRSWSLIWHGAGGIVFPFDVVQEDLMTCLDLRYGFCLASRGYSDWDLDLVSE